MAVDRPSAYPEWAQNDVVNPTSGQNNVVAPDAAHKSDGWEFKEKPPRQYFNWLGRQQENWTRYLEAAGCEKIQGMKVTRTSASVWILDGRARGIGGNQDAITLPAPIEKGIGTWAIGNGTGGVAAGVFPWAPDSWIHVFVIKRDSDGVVDAGFDTNLDASALLSNSGFDQYRRVGSAYLVDDVSDYIRMFLHVPDIGFVQHQDMQYDLVGSIPGPGSVASIVMSLAVPPGLELRSECHVRASYGSSTWAIKLWDGFYTAFVPPNGGPLMSGAAGFTEKRWFHLVTDTSQTVYAEAVPPTTGGPVGFNFGCRGYFDTRDMPLSTWY